MLIIVGILFSIAAVWGRVVEESEFDWKVANTSIWLSAAAYCNASSFLTREYEGYTKDFVAVNSIISEEFDVQVA
jgi:hypothetical protein